MKRRNAMLWTAGAAAGAAAAFGSYAALTWLRYGRPRLRYSTPALDRYMPKPEVIETSRIEVNAPAGVAYEACRRIDIMHLPIARVLFAARARLMCAGEARQRELSSSLIEQMQTLGWRVLDDLPGREIVMGAACKPWEADAQFRSIAPEDFATFSEAGWAKIVWNFRVDALSASTSVVRTQTRVTTTDAESRRRFRRYWALASPGIIFIRVFALRIVKSEAEKGVTYDSRKSSATCS